MMGTTDESMYNYDLSAKGSLDLFLRSLFSATFTDRLSGGPLHVYRLRLHGQSWEPICHRDVLKAYADYYDDYDEEKTLFLIFNSAKIFDPVYSDDLKSFFRAYGEIDIAHRVAHIPIAKNTGFYFHRLVCKTAEDATRIHDHVKKGGGPHGLDLSKVPVLLREFPDGVFFHTMQPTLRLYVNRCSKRLLQVIRDSVSTK
ncbi:uncharacterized protein LOC133726998 [Rosa rugosa]|uniref:uncharacterized protein LOC133726998 n=1 Tax=Rosa rugosa TaxID=74645 RepID=UPI002B41091F|nr:uncharacterized protein LOC133726998 [Rosa rugosa]